MCHHLHQEHIHEVSGVHRSVTITTITVISCLYNDAVIHRYYIYMSDIISLLFNGMIQCISHFLQINGKTVKMILL